MTKKSVAVLGVKGLPGYGGSARANEKLLLQLQQDFDITVYALDTHASDNNYQGIKQIIFKSKSNKKLNSIVFFIKSVCHILFRANYDIIQLNHGVSGFILPFVRLKYKRVVTTIRGLNYRNDDKWNLLEFYLLRFFEILSFRLSATIVTVQKSSVVEIQKYTQHQVLYIPNGVEDNFSTFQVIPKGPDLVFSAARIIHLKGLHNVLEALHLIDFKGTLKVIGDLNQVEKYKEKIQELSKGLNIINLGLIKDKVKLYSQIRGSKLFIFPSYSEGMSNMLLEVASLKIPILASDISQNMDVFDSTEAEFFRVGDSGHLAEILQMLLKDDKKMKALSDKAYLKVKKDYQWPIVAKSYSDLYHQLLKVD